MKTVYTKEQLEETLKKGEKALVKGSLASEIRKKYETRKKVRKSTAIAGGAIAVAGLVAAPFTGGTSLVGTDGCKIRCYGTYYRYYNHIYW